MFTFIRASKLCIYVIGVPYGVWCLSLIYAQSAKSRQQRDNSASRQGFIAGTQQHLLSQYCFLFYCYTLFYSYCSRAAGIIGCQLASSEQLNAQWAHLSLRVPPHLCVSDQFKSLCSSLLYHSTCLRLCCGPPPLFTKFLT